VTNGTRNTVFILEGNRVIETPVTLGPPLGDMVEVLTGAKAGDRVVIRPSKRLRNDSRIKILEK